MLCVTPDRADSADPGLLATRRAENRCEVQDWQAFDEGVGEARRTEQPRRLKDAGYQTPSDAGAVFCITRQLPRKKSLLVEKPPYQDRHHGRNRQQSPARSERQWRADNKQQTAGIHGMAYNRVGTRRDDRLTLRHFDRRRRKAVFAEDDENDEPPQCNEDVAKKDYGNRNVRPLHPVIKCWHDKERDEAETRNEHNHLFLFLLFGCWSAPHATLQQRRVSSHEVQHDKH